MKQTMILLTLVTLFLLTSVALAQESYELSWWTVNSGGGASSGGGYALVGTIGQPEAGVMSGGNYTLVGGFWSGGVPAGGSVVEPLYLPIVLKRVVN